MPSSSPSPRRAGRAHRRSTGSFMGETSTGSSSLPRILESVGQISKGKSQTYAVLRELLGEKFAHCACIEETLLEECRRIPVSAIVAEYRRSRRNSPRAAAAGLDQMDALGPKTEAVPADHSKSSDLETCESGAAGHGGRVTPRFGA